MSEKPLPSYLRFRHLALVQVSLITSCVITFLEPKGCACIELWVTHQQNQEWTITRKRDLRTVELCYNYRLSPQFFIFWLFFFFFFTALMGLTTSVRTQKQTGETYQQRQYEKIINKQISKLANNSGKKQEGTRRKDRKTDINTQKKELYRF